MTDDLLAFTADDESLLQPIQNAEEYLQVEIVYAATHEAALHMDDLLARRTRISIETPDRGTACAKAVAELAGRHLGWDSDRIANEVESYEARVAAERESQAQSTDLEADAARVAAPDTRQVAVGRALH
jgi:glycerol-3-phosphate dehydrogenase